MSETAWFWLVSISLHVLIIWSAVFTVRRWGWRAMLPPMPMVLEALIWGVKKRKGKTLKRRS